MKIKNTKYILGKHSERIQRYMFEDSHCSIICKTKKRYIAYKQGIVLINYGVHIQSRSVTGRKQSMYKISQQQNVEYTGEINAVKAVKKLARGKMIEGKIMQAKSQMACKPL